MAENKYIVSFDCGNSSFRTILGVYDGERIESKVIQQTPNEMIKIGDYYYWDILKIYSGLLEGLKMVSAEYHIDSIGVCTWGVDFALFDAKGFMLSNPLSYRNSIGAKTLTALDERAKEKLFDETGIVCDKINSCYMLKGIRDISPELFEAADRLLLIPDILNYYLTGNMFNEPSELSTTQLMDAKTKGISLQACSILNVPNKLIGRISEHGTSIGGLSKDIREELGINYEVPVISVPSHDTASAVLAVPARKEQFAFISSGTWSLIGTELESPIINEEVRKHDLTNEVGAFDTITLLKNNAGMFLIQRLKKEYQQEERREVDWEELNALGDNAESNDILFDVNDERFFNPVNMSEALWCYFMDKGLVQGEKDWSVIIRSFVRSMALSYAETIEKIEKISGLLFDSIYIIGGGSQNRRLCKETANLTGRRVVAGGKESTSLGNIMAQIKYFEPDKSINELRDIVGRSIDVKEYIPLKGE